MLIVILVMKVSFHLIRGPPLGSEVINCQELECFDVLKVTARTHLYAVVISFNKSCNLRMMGCSGNGMFLISSEGVMDAINENGIRVNGIITQGDTEQSPHNRSRGGCIFQ